ncbi:PAS domain-containing sensor histidine kinase [Rhodobacter sp. SY28-1]|uniref:hybrid sensor histidine kinase/response regulator n=1 Tax=Rhodobacter sp. SY28-1 TaxID=2562317 RepID=UPI001F0E58AD|nr:PAS domain-containing sensor histidine kinase [Rhodobacter sp. SY28-1]
MLHSRIAARQGDRDSHLAFLLVADDPIPCFLTDSAGRMVLRNRAAETRFGADAHTLLAVIGQRTLNPGELLHRLQQTANAEGAAQEDLLGHNSALRLSVHRADVDRYFWRAEDRAPSADLPPLPAGARPPVVTVGADLEDVPVAIMTFGPDGVMRTANLAARELMWNGETRAAMFHDLFEGLGRPVSEWLADVTAGRHPGGSEVLRQRGEAERYLQITLRRYVENGRLGALAILNDATRLKTLEAQFVQSQKMQAIGQLAGGIAHDFNNLLTAISGHCDLLLMRHGREDTDFADLEQIRQNANRAASLVGQLLAFSRKQTLNPEVLDLEDVLADLIHLLNRLMVEKVDLSLAHLGREGNRPLGRIRADKRQIEQVLINLVVNARDAMPDGGDVRIETEAVTLAQDLQRDRATVPAGDYTVIRVVDQGIGIPEHQLRQIFEPFFTTKRIGEGTGLGLSMAYGIMKQSGGFIFVDSVLGQGTTFSLYFPVFDGDAQGTLPSEPRRVAARKGEGVVLLVEDEASVRAFASRALTLRGYTVLEAASAEEALARLEDKSLHIDLFVTDVVMPGMDGPAWVRRAHLNRPGVKVVFMSGYADDGLAEDQARVPNSVFLPKPFSLSDLTNTVQGLLS